MRKGIKKRVISLVLAVLMLATTVLSDVNALTVNAEGEQSYAWLVTSLDQIGSEDKVMISVIKEDGTIYGLPAADATGAVPKAATLSATDGQISAASASVGDFGWTLTATENGYTFTNANGKYLSMNNANTGTRVNDKAFAWTIDGGFLFGTSSSTGKDGTVTETDRYLGVYTNTPDWRTYTTTNNFGGQTLTFWKYSAVEAPVTPVCAAVKATPDSSQVVVGTTVALSCETADATIMYKLEGDTDYAVYTEPVAVKAPTSIMAYAAKEGFNDSAVSTFAYTVKAAAVTKTVAEFKADKDQVNETILSGTVTYVNGKNVYIQDATGGVCVYLSKSDSSIKVGNTLTAKGVYALYSGLCELNKATVESNVEGTAVVEPVETSIAAIKADINDAKYQIQGTRVVVKNLTMGATENSITTFTDASNETIQVYKLPTLEGIAQGDMVTLTGVAYCNKNVAQLAIVEAKDVVKVEAEKVIEGKKLDKLSDGDQVIIYNANNKLQLASTTVTSGTKTWLAGVSAEAQTDGTMYTAEKAAVVTVSTRVDGETTYYTFKNESDETLVTTATGNELYFKADTTDMDAEWVLETKEGLEGFLMKSSSAKYNEKDQYIEYYSRYSEFKVTSYNETYASDYAVCFYEANKTKTELEDPGTEKPGTEDPSTDTPVASGSKKLETLSKGDKVVMYQVGSKNVVSSEAKSTKYLDVITTELNTDGTLTIPEKAAVFTVDILENGNYTFKDADGKFLSCGSTGGSAYISDSADYLKEWVVTAVDGGYTIKSSEAVYNENPQYFEYYSKYTEFTTGKYNETYLNNTYLFNFYEAKTGEETPEVTDGLTDGSYVIYNPANKKILSSVLSGNYLSGVDKTISDLSETVKAAATDVWTLKNNEDGTVTISVDGKNLSMDTSYSSTPLGKVNDKWTLEKQADGTYYIKNEGRASYLEWYASKEYFSAYSKITDDTAGLFKFNFVKAEAEEPAEEEPEVNPLASGTYFMHSEAAAGVMAYGWVGGSATLVAGTVEDGKFSFTGDGEGAAILTVERQTDGTYTMKVGDKYLSANTADKKEELYLSDTAKRTTTAGSYWNITWKESTNGYLVKNASALYNAYADVYFEYYSSNGFSLYSYKETNAAIYTFNFFDATGFDGETVDGYVGTMPLPANPISEGKTYTIRNISANGVIGPQLEAVDGGEISMSAVDSEIDENGNVVVDNGGLIFTARKAAVKATVDAAGELFTVKKNGDDYTFVSSDGKYLTTGATGGSLSLAASESDYSLWNLENGNDGYRIVNKNAAYSSKKQYIEYFSSSKYLCFKATSYNSSYDAYYTVIFIGKDGNVVSNLSDSDQVYICNPKAACVVTATQSTLDTKGLNGVAASGFTSNYWTFENNGKYLASNADEELFLKDECDEYTQWELVETLGGYLLKNRAAAWVSSSGNSYPIYVEYFSGAFAGYSYKAATPKIFTFNFDEAEDTYKTGYVINPRVKFGNVNPANLGVDYTVEFTLDDLGTISSNSASVKFEDGTVKKVETEIDGYEGMVTVSKSLLDGHTSMTVTVDATSVETETVSVDFSGSVEVEIKDEPVITSVSPAANAQTGEDKRPGIVVNYANIGEDAVATLTVNDKAVELTHNSLIHNFLYNPTEDMEDGKYTICATITRKDGKVATKTWSFTVGRAGAQLYFGQIHSHTAEYSDGSGTLEQAYEYSMNTAKNCDYMIVTDHSNYFDTTSSNSKDSIYSADADTILASSTKDANGNTLNKWQEAKATAAEYNAKSSDFTAAYGYEMTWSGGPGHINVFNTAGIVSRNNTELNNKTNNSGMFAFYDLLVSANDKGTTSLGSGSVSAQFNHPGTTFGYFDSFAGYSAERDGVMNLIEVGNGDGFVGGTAYFPSYEYYDMALQAGWHIAPTNGQDNHKGLWGDSNSCRTVALAENNSESAIYDAMAQRHVYSTEDQNLSMYFYLDEVLQGGVISGFDKDKVTIDVSISDADSESLGRVYVIGDKGQSAPLYTSDNIADNTADLQIVLDNTSAYYYIKVVEKDGDIAVSAPVWVKDIASSTANVSAALSIDGDPTEKATSNVKLTLTNGEASDAKVASYTITVNDKVVANVTPSDMTIVAGKASEVSYSWTPEKYGNYEIKASAVVTVGGKSYTKTVTKTVYVNNADANTVKTIKEALNGQEFEAFTVEGTVTSNASGYNKNLAFFDCIYVQDATGGINVFPVAGNYEIGQKVKVHGVITYYNGEIELNVSEQYGGYVELTNAEKEPLAATSVSTADAMKADNIGLLMQVSGEVTRVHVDATSGVIDRIYVNDGSGDACAYINGYIYNSNDLEGDNKSAFGADFSEIKVGDSVVITGIGSVDVDELGEVEYLHRLRIRDRAEISKQQNSAFTGFVEKANGKYYYVDDIPQSGWQQVDGSWYYCETGYFLGRVRVGEHKIGYTTYTFDENGILVRGGFRDYNGFTYYYWAGVYQTGWQTIDGNTYYFNENGSKGHMQTGIVEIDGKFYEFADNGILVGQCDAPNGFVKNTDGIFCYENGTVKTGWFEVEGKWYFGKTVAPNVGVLRTGVSKVNSVTYTFDKDGALVQGGFLVKDSGTTYYYFAGQKVKNSFVEHDGKTYYFDWLGRMKTGTIKIDGTVYTFDENGVLQ